MASTKPPPPTTSSTPYVIGVIVLLLLAFGLYRWKASTADTTPQITTVVASATQNEVPVLDAPPPPPKVEGRLPRRAGPTRAAPRPRSRPAAATAAAAARCDNAPASPAAPVGVFRGAAAQSAQAGCYQRALRTSEASGSMTVSVQVGPGGSVCSAGLAVDNVHSNEVAQCVLGRFRGRSFPSPGTGCSTVNIPINFVAK